jgi:pimeloyl-ACP methyl ester carboxylesterase/ABC-type transporter MlaC component
MSKPTLPKVTLWRAAALAAGLGLAMLSYPVHAGPASRGDTVQGLYNALLATMKNGRTLGQSGRFTQLEPVIRRSFDIPAIARLSVGPSWASLSEAQRQQVTDSFARYISAIYADRFDSYAGQKLEVIGEQPAAAGVMVKSQIIKANGEPVKIRLPDAPQWRGLADLRHLSRRRDQRGGDAPFGIRRDPQKRGRRRADRRAQPQSRHAHRHHRESVLTPPVALLPHRQQIAILLPVSEAGVVMTNCADVETARVRTFRTATLEIAYRESGPPEGRPVILLHGFPDDVHAYDGVAPPLAAAGWRVLVPFLRGYGPTRFLSDETPRSGQQAALGRDLADFIDALGLERAVVAGYDWGGRAACIVAALWPERTAGLVTIGGYNIQNIAASGNPDLPAAEYRYWYQWYFHTERGRAGLTAHRRPLCRLLWELWSPNYRFDDTTYERTAASFDNPDFVEVVIQSYRHRYAAAPGDPALEAIEAQLALQPPITVPTISLYGECDGVSPPDRLQHHAQHFIGPYKSHVISIAGHFLPREAPKAVIDAVCEL